MNFKNAGIFAAGMIAHKHIVKQILKHKPSTPHKREKISKNEERLGRILGVFI